MNKLYYVSAYSHRLNQYMRVLYTAPDANAVEGRLVSDYEDDWRAERIEYVCMTPEEVGHEL